MPSPHSQSVRTVGVVGAGIMGHGIAHVAARSGLGVILVDLRPDLVDQGLRAIGQEMRRAVEKGRMTEADLTAALERITPGEGPVSLDRADLVVEAILEKEEAKRTVFAELDRVCRPDAVLASNTSSISITRLAAATTHPERVIGMHFMNPVPVMALGEVIGGRRTSDETVSRTVACATAMGKTTVEVNDYPGFVSNRILMPMINEAITALMEGVASAESIDAVMKLGMNHPMGPLALADLIGLDTCLDIMKVLHEGFGDPRYRPSPLLRRMVDEGHLGRKTGRGFFEYPAPGRPGG